MTQAITGHEMDGTDCVMEDHSNTVPQSVQMNTLMVPCFSKSLNPHNIQSSELLLARIV